MLQLDASLRGCCYRSTASPKHRDAVLVPRRHRHRAPVREALHLHRRGQRARARTPHAHSAPPERRNRVVLARRDGRGPRRAERCERSGRMLVWSRLATRLLRLGLGLGLEVGLGDACLSGAGLPLTCCGYG